MDGDRMSVGAAVANDVAIMDDGRVSRLHAVFERLAGGWCVKDLDSRNGTAVNGARISAERPLHNGDEIRVGDTLMIFRTDEMAAGPPTQVAIRAPYVTERERDVLLELCRPLASGDVFTEPASVRQIADSLTVTEGAVKQHLANLYDKFGLQDGDQNRRVRLANEALHRGVIQLADLRGPRARTGP
jgi:pSer/pThr/pTyr-binding forkhead associated (FHA) protein